MTAQGSRDLSNLIGTWTFDHTFSFSEKEASVDEVLNANVELKLRVEAAYINRKITFNANGEYQQVLANGETTKGTWREGAQNTVVIEGPNGNSYVQRIGQLTKTKLILIPVASKETKPVIPRWHFTKI
ncbi:MAG: hypothetical protein AB3N16_06435 [Flavobacteriaceae bacterium]